MIVNLEESIGLRIYRWRMGKNIWISIDLKPVIDQAYFIFRREISSKSC